MSTSVEATMQDQLLWYSVKIKRYDATTRGVFSVWGPQQVFPEGPPSVDFVIDSGVGMVSFTFYRYWYDTYQYSYPYYSL